ncbi:hypothetical protein [Gordoniibacillus kamchatkensis]|nr:hypothetical protein [Paenibacillus sp. VKM B-2647]
MPEWIWSDANFSMCLSNDIDSFFSATLLKKIKNWNISHFYDFSSIYKSNQQPKGEKLIGVDIALEGNAYCFDNHVTLLNAGDTPNPNSCNINNILNITRDNYFQKYCMGTNMLILSLFSVFDLKSLSDDQKIFLWCVDVSYKGHYSNYENDRNAHSTYIEILQLEPIADVFDRYSPDDFRQFIKEYLLFENIKVNEAGRLTTGIRLDLVQKLFPELELSLPEEKFIKTHSFKLGKANLPQNKKLFKGENKRLFSSP